MTSLQAYNLYSNPILCSTKQIRFTRSKKRRLKKKFAKKYTVRVPDDNYYIVGGNSIVANPAMISKLMELAAVSGGDKLNADHHDPAVCMPGMPTYGTLNFITEALNNADD